MNFKFDSVKYFEKMETDLSWNTSTNPRNREVEKQQDQVLRFLYRTMNY